MLLYAEGVNNLFYNEIVRICGALLYVFHYRKFTPQKSLLVQKKSVSGKPVLYSLRDDPTVIMKTADKGRAVVICDEKDYLKEAAR